MDEIVLVPSVMARDAVEEALAHGSPEDLLQLRLPRHLVGPVATRNSTFRSLESVGDDLDHAAAGGGAGSVVDQNEDGALGGAQEVVERLSAVAPGQEVVDEHRFVAHFDGARLHHLSEAGLVDPHRDRRRVPGHVDVHRVLLSSVTPLGRDASPPAADGIRGRRRRPVRLDPVSPRQQFRWVHRVLACRLGQLHAAGAALREPPGRGLPPPPVSKSGRPVSMLRSKVPAFMPNVPAMPQQPMSRFTSLQSWHLLQ